MYYDLKTKKIVENKESKSLYFLYNTVLGRLILKIIASHIIAKTYAKYMNSRLSILKIKSFIKKNNIDINEYEEKKYNSFNDFFIRKIKKNKRKIEDGLIAIADSKLTVYEINQNSSFKIKNSIYTVEELIQNNVNKYEYALIFRLEAHDYHHYCFPDDGKVLSNKKIKGILHTVQPIAFKKHKVFVENTRNITFLKCNNLGNVCYIEVGAMMIGKIVNEPITSFKKGDEKGHFEFGGSTIVLLLEKGKATIDKQIIENSKKEIETIVKLGTKIGGIHHEK